MIVTEDLRLKKTPTKFIPRFLTNEQKLCRLATCEDMLEMTRTDPEWKDKIITGDETWVYGYDPETKRQSAEWRGQDIAPNDFFLFPKLKAVLKGRHFDTREDIIEKSLLALKSIPKEAYKNCFDNWEKRWRWRARLNWCLEHHAWTHDQWANVLFSDESRFSLNTDSRRVFIWREPGTRYHPSNIREIDSFRGSSLLVWAGISSSRRTPLHIFSGGTLTAQRYRDEILEPYLRPYGDQIGHNLIFKDDNARPHRARLVNEYLQSENIRRMDWPARSTDLNPIEHVWDALGRRIGARHPSPRTLVELRTALLEEWGLLHLDLLQSLVNSMRARCETLVAVRETNGVGPFWVKFLANFSFLFWLASSLIFDQFFMAFNIGGVGLSLLNLIPSLRNGLMGSERMAELFLESKSSHIATISSRMTRATPVFYPTVDVTTVILRSLIQIRLEGAGEHVTSLCARIRDRGR
ncbi:hypothetical protein LAZ67_8000631 [Cordylochernes scorpioides]|uniref:Tc1-like transposase DDE domain-containing protein n=1 Tax=Cordylochernes scorpioides TaxID=51811 RepID=A0ABY6KR58_9ARAC|nr:hypothetical protein LAZ67_8000631 [Cordylochernes scorpioides]